MTLLHQAAQKAVERIRHTLMTGLAHNDAIAALNELAALQQQPEPVARGVAELEQRYIVFKIKDVERLTQQQRDALYIVTSAVQQRRYERGADQHMPCLVVEKDWPEYAPTLAAILARADGVPAPREGLLPGLSWDEIAALERAPVQQVAPDSEASRRGFEHEVACDSALQHQEVPREPVAPSDGREQFEAWLRARWPKAIRAIDEKTPAGFYMFNENNFYWEAWQASRAAASPSTTRQQEVGSGWISVYDRRPEVGTECLVWAHPSWSKGPHVALDTWDEQRECPVAWSTASIPIGDGWDSHEFEEVSHWMPIPAAPSTPENAGGVQGTKASSYKLLDHGDVIQCGDEVLADDTVNWLPLVGWEVGMKWGCNFMPMRRPAGVAVPQAPTVRQSSNQRDEKE